MSWRMIRLVGAFSVVVLGLTVCGRSAQAQITTNGDITSDPFAFYYAFYLPNQQIQALRPKPQDTINENVLLRQYYAQTQRPSLYNPVSAYTEPEFDPLRPYSQQQGKERIAEPYRFVQNPSNADGSGPSLYYNRAAQYYPGLRAGRGPNANVSPGRRRTGGRGGVGSMGAMGAMGGMGGMGMGMGMPG
jgi:hypothetical protein